MSQITRRFYHIDDALDAVRMALAQYPGQLNLLGLIWPMVFGDEAYVLSDAPNRSVWVKIPGQSKLVRASEADLKRRILDRLWQSPPDAQALARICTRVFGVVVRVGLGPLPDRSPGIWIDTDMRGFVCTRCGHCCLTLNYHDGCSLEDYRRWQELGRDDILEWVGTVASHGQITACRIWITPGTNQYAPTCPWLKKIPDQKRCACIIHALRPTICRQYPGSRKHARMTGCRGV